MNVAVSLSSDAVAPSSVVSLVRDYGERILHALALQEVELSIQLVDDAEMALLNETYRGKQGPTDVLSFSLATGEHAQYCGGLLGDVVIDFAQAKRQAAELGHRVEEELLRLLIHGVLHLLGHDHEQDEEAARMQAEEERLWTLLAQA